MEKMADLSISAEEEKDTEQKKSTSFSRSAPDTPDPRNLPDLKIKQSKQMVTVKNFRPESQLSSTDSIDDEYMAKMHEQVARLTKDQRRCIQETFHDALEKNLVKSGKTIMLKLFSEFPHYKSIWQQFRAVPDSSLMNAEQLSKHASIYMGGLRLIINSMDDDDKLNKALRKIAHAHIKWGIFKSHILHMLPALLEVVNENSATEVDKETKDAWTTLFDVIANLIDIFRVAEGKKYHNRT